MIDDDEKEEDAAEEEGADEEGASDDDGGLSQEEIDALGAGDDDDGGDEAGDEAASDDAEGDDAGGDDELDWDAAFEEQAAAELDDLDGDGGPSEAAAEAHLADAAEQFPSLDKILALPVTMSVEIGTTDISIRNLLQLTQGSVVELDRLAGEPLDVKVNGVLVAHGEVVVVNEKYGVRLTDVVSAKERIEKLK